MPPEPDASPREDRRPPPIRGLLARLRIRKKLILLHTVFSLLLLLILMVAIRPAVGRVVRTAEEAEARLLLRVAAAQGSLDAAPVGEGVEARLRAGSAEELSLRPEVTERARSLSGSPVLLRGRPGWQGVLHDVTPEGERFLIAGVTMAEARAAVWRLYLLVGGALLCVYGLVAVSLEVLVLPRHVYGPLRRILEADQALRRGDTGHETIPDGAMPADELGEIMRSRNASVRALRQQERELAGALGRLEESHADLTRKNHMLERARRNLADADRLVSLGMMSAGLAHEMNTPLAVLKGMAERIASNPGAGLEPGQAALMRRVVARLERLSESLLDFARVRTPRAAHVAVRALVDEAVTLVRLDREGASVDYANAVPESLRVLVDGDGMLQVLVNLIRNGADSARESPREPARGQPRVEIGSEELDRDGERWVRITVRDNGAGIAPDILPRLFEPFASTRLDARGTGLGLAVAEGIVREHGGVMLARNIPDGRGALFEVLLPCPQAGPAPAAPREAP